jgi:TolB protein
VTASVPPEPVVGTGIVFYSVRGSSVDIFVVGANGKGAKRLTTATEPDSGGVWSPDGTKIAFESRQTFEGLPDGFAQVWVMNADGSDEHPITTDASNNVHAAWSPDGSQIVFESDRTRSQQLFIMNADGTDEAQKTNIAGGATLPAWSANDVIAFDRRVSTGTEIWAINASGDADPRRLIDGTAAYPAWSPDGNSIAFASTRVGRTYQVFTATDSGGNVRRVSSDPTQAISPAWSPDGRRIAYEGTAGGHRQLFTISANGGTATRLISTSFDDKRPSWR